MFVSEASAHKTPSKPAPECTLTPSGRDDSPRFLAAARSCSTVTIPEDATLNISTKLDMTGMSNLKIVSDTATSRVVDANAYITGLSRT